MKLPLHAWRRRSVVPEASTPHPPPPASPPPRDASAPSYDPDFPITTSRPTQPVEFTMNMKDMVKEDWATVKHFMRHMDWRKVLKAMTVRWIWKWYLIAAIAITLTVLITTQHDAVVKFCSPVARQIRSWPAGWMIPLVLLIIVSYPPLVGHEIIGILIGLVWGMGQGFVILAAGTFIGEVLLWFSFKWCCTNAAAKFEKKNKLYWSLTQLIREKTFMFVLILRFSAIPGHIVTAVSASAGANYWSYLAAAFLTLPKQLSIVYLGEAFGHKEQKHLIVSNAMLLLTIIVTGIAAIYIYYQMRLVWKRREMELPSVVGVPMVENPTWADVVEAEKASVEQKENAEDNVYLPQLGKDDVNGIMTRKPWLAKAAYGSRAWSVPHHMTEAEMREFREEMEQSEPIPTVRVDEAPPRFNSSFDVSRTGASTPTRTLQLEIPPDQIMARSSSQSSAGPPSPSRMTNSLDLARPGSAIGGRYVADDADNYAYSRGGRRPDYTRMRGESRAALLGRPKEEDVPK